MGWLGGDGALLPPCPQGAGFLVLFMEQAVSMFGLSSTVPSRLVFLRLPSSNTFPSLCPLPNPPTPALYIRAMMGSAWRLGGGRHLLPSNHRGGYSLIIMLAGEVKSMGHLRAHNL